MPREYFPATTDSIADLNELNAAFHDAASPSKYPKTLSKQERNTAAANIRAALKGKTGQKRAEARAEQMDPGPSDDAEKPSHKPLGNSSSMSWGQGGMYGVTYGNPKETAAEHGLRAAHEIKHPHEGTTPESIQASAEAAAHYAHIVQGEHRGVPGKSMPKGYKGDPNKLNLSKAGRKALLEGTGKKPGKRETAFFRKHANEDSDDASYEQRERKAIQGEAKSKGSTSFNFGANETQKTRTQRGLATPKLVKTRTPRNYASQERKAIQGEAKSKGSTAFPFGANKV
jgi:hypothetical protein